MNDLLYFSLIHPAVLVVGIAFLVLRSKKATDSTSEPKKEDSPTAQPKPEKDDVSNAGFTWPLDNARSIGIDYGLTERPGNRKKTRYHRGIDIGGEEDDNLIAIADGEVVRASANQAWSAYGLRLDIRHVINGTVYYSVYGHCNNLENGENKTLKVGDQVKKGDRVGGMGGGKGDPNAGNSMGVHLHFEIRQGKNYRKYTVDPVPLLTQNRPNPLYRRGAIMRSQG